MGNCLRDSQKTVDVIGIGKHLAGDFPGRGAALRHQTHDVRLPFMDGAEVTIEKFFVVVNRFAVAAVNQRRREAAHTRQAHQILG